ncbi:MAG: hypothetical protein Q8P67_01950 [archaeon]|nr:hypothetical protein [archaeon]
MRVFPRRPTREMLRRFQLRARAAMGISLKRTALKKKQVAQSKCAR